MNLTTVSPTSVIMFQNCAAFFLHSCVFYSRRLLCYINVLICLLFLSILCFYIQVILNRVGRTQFTSLLSPVIQHVSFAI